MPANPTAALAFGLSSSTTSTIEDLTSQIFIPPYAVCYGGFSAVYSGTYISNGRKVAVKVLSTREHRDDRERIRKHLYREALVWNRVNHVRIAKFHGIAFMGPEGLPALVSDWYDRGVATRYLEGRTMAEKMTVIQDISDAVAYLHSLTIVHGDIKGNNVLISNQGRGVLTDFGLSRVIGLVTGCTTSSMPGSLRWQAPELFLSSCTPASKSKQSDVWAFGCTAYELLSGQVPYAPFKTAYILAQEIILGSKPLDFTAIDLPATIRNILHQCWVLDPSNRPTMDEVLRLLSQ